MYKKIRLSDPSLPIPTKGLDQKSRLEHIKHNREGGYTTTQKTWGVQ